MKKERRVSLYIIASIVFSFYLPQRPRKLSHWYIRTNLQSASINVVDRALSIINIFFISSPLTLGVHQGWHEYDQEKDCWSTHNEGDSNKITKKDLNNSVVHFSLINVRGHDGGDGCTANKNDSDKSKAHQKIPGISCPVVA